MLTPRPHSSLWNIQVWELGPEFREEPLGSCDQHALGTLIQKL